MSDVDLRFYFSLFLRRLPLFLAVAAAVMTAAVVLAYALPPVYRASAKILVEAPEIPADLARPTVPSDAVAQLQIMQEQVSTRENLVAVAEKLDAYPPGTPSDDIVDDMRARTTFELVKMSETSDRGGAIVFRIAFDAADPELSADVVNELARFILDKNARLRTDRAGDTSAFFSKEASQLAGELSAVDEKILAFKKAHAEALPDNLPHRRTQQQNAQERLLVLEREASTLRNRRDALAQMRALKGDVVNVGALTLEQQLLQDLKRQLAEQLAIFAEDSPNIAALKLRVAALDARAREQAAAKDSGDRTLSSELDLQLFDADERLKSITQEQTTLKVKIEEAGALIAETPANEAVLNGLVRTRDNLQVQYNAVLARQADAATGRQIELLSKGERFSLVEPAAPPSDPTSPRRVRIIGAGVAGGVGLGVGLIVLLEMLTKTLRRPADVVALFQTQPLATIPDIRLAGEAGRSRAYGGLRLAASIVLAFIILISLSFHHGSVGSIVEGAATSLIDDASA